MAALFAPDAPGHSVATLFLIENSPSMTPLWPNLRIHHLPNIFYAIRGRNPAVPIQVLWMRSSGTLADGPPYMPCDHTQLPMLCVGQVPETCFTSEMQPQNRITLSSLYRAVKLVGSAFQDLPATCHLFIVAASSPINDLDGAHPSVGGCDPWQTLASVLHDKNIYLHLILRAALENDMERYIELFNRTSCFYPSFRTDLRLSADCGSYSFFLSCKSNTTSSLLQPPATLKTDPTLPCASLARNPPLAVSVRATSSTSHTPSGLALHAQHDPSCGLTRECMRSLDNKGEGGPRSGDSRTTEAKVDPGTLHRSQCRTAPAQTGREQAMLPLPPLSYSDTPCYNTCVDLPLAPALKSVDVPSTGKQYPAPLHPPPFPFASLSHQVQSSSLPYTGTISNTYSQPRPQMHFHQPTYPGPEYQRVTEQYVCSTESHTPALYAYNEVNGLQLDERTEWCAYE